MLFCPKHLRILVQLSFIRAANEVEHLDQPIVLNSRHSRRNNHSRLVLNDRVRTSMLRRFDRTADFSVTGDRPHWNKRQPNMPRRQWFLSRLGVLILTLSVLTTAIVLADRPRAQQGLEPFNSLIGEWRGIGQPRRGSNRGAWKQTGEWVWDFKDQGAALHYLVTDGKLLRDARLTFDPETDFYVMEITSTDEQSRRYQGRLTDRKLTLEAEPDPEGTTHRLTITLLNENRTLVLHEKREANQQRFFRVAEVGYTRAGVRLAKPGGGQPECIVTGGAGTIEVSPQRKDLLCLLQRLQTGVRG